MMFRKKLTKGFGVYYDASKSTSGQRFFGDLYKEMSHATVDLNKRPASILFNVSAPLIEVIKAKVRGQKVIVRIDSLYFDRLSPAFLSTFSWPLRKLFSLGLNLHFLHSLFSYIANFLNQNYTSFARIILADHIIYQSEFSKIVHQKYFPSKPFDIIVNGTTPKNFDRRLGKRKDTIEVVTIYDEFRPSKRIHDIVRFIQWANTSKDLTVILTIVGYTGNIPPCVPDSIKEIIETSPYIKTFPRFKDFSGKIGELLAENNLYITFSYRDSCPNAVVEAMSHGLPVLGVTSGGIPDIVGEAGILLKIDDFETGFYTAHRFESEFPEIDFELVYKAIIDITGNQQSYFALANRRFVEVLDISRIAERYISAIRNFCEKQYE